MPTPTKPISLFLYASLVIGAASQAHAADCGIIAPGAELKLVADTFKFTEGPASDAAGNVYFTDQPNNRILRWDAGTGTITEWMKPAGRSNGMDFDAAGNLIACADEKNELWSIAPDQSVSVLTDDVEGRLLNGPNDCWVDPLGGIYFTDPLYKRPWWERQPESQLDGRHVYYLSADRDRLVRVATGFEQRHVAADPGGELGAALLEASSIRVSLTKDGDRDDLHIHPLQAMDFPRLC